MCAMYVIVNPIAGRGYGARAAPEIERILNGLGVAFDLTLTARAGEAVDLARRAVLDGYDTIVAAGGDGTYQEVINGMLQAADDGEVGTLGVLPVGSGCDFSYAVGIPPTLEEACARLVDGQARPIDLGRAPGGWAGPPD